VIGLAAIMTGFLSLVAAGLVGGGAALASWMAAIFTRTVRSSLVAWIVGMVLALGGWLLLRALMPEAGPADGPPTAEDFAQMFRLFAWGGALPGVVLFGGAITQGIAVMVSFVNRPAAEGDRPGARSS
jgi:hypothetical protein